MHVFLPGLLPPAAFARELAAQLPTHAPTLFAWMQRLSAEVETLSPGATGCTPAEVWELRRAGFVPQPGQRLSAGLGPLRAGLSLTDQEPVWLADLVHIALGARHVTMADPAQLAVSETQDRALFDAVFSGLDGCGVVFSRLMPGRWRVQLPAAWSPPSASPAVVCGGALDDWWPQNEANRPWRRLLNEVQMIWHEHPVNIDRATQGQLPVNSLWLYGGARPWAPPPVGADDILVRDDLAAPAAAGDWAGWLAALVALDRELSTQIPLAARGNAPHIVLTGTDRLVTLTPSSHWLPDWFRRCKHAWTSWWHPPV